MGPTLLLNALFDLLDEEVAYVIMEKPEFRTRQSYERSTVRLQLQASPTDPNAPVSPYVPQDIWARGT